MPNTTQEKLFETFVAIWGGHQANPDSTIDASDEQAALVANIAKVMDRVPAPKSDPVYTTGTPPAASLLAAWFPERDTSERIPAVVPPGDAPPAIASPASIPANIPTQPPSQYTPLPDPIVATPRPPAETAVPSTTSTVESVASNLLRNVFGSVPLIGAIQSAQAGNSSGIGGTLETIASTVLKSGLGLVPLIGGLLGLFGGSDAPEPAPLVKYAMPPSIAFRGADTESGIAYADYDQMGMPRSYGAAAPAASAPAAPPQITVNVQAMDARSFLDRSSDIAAAVREAMLNLNSLNDVVSEL